MGACELESGDVALAAIPIRKMTIGIAQTLLLIIDWRIAMPKRTTGDQPELKPVNVGAAAIDIGSKMHMAAVNPACTDVPVRSFGTFTQDLHDLADWFKACGVTSVAMESTGVYWIPVYEILEQHGFEVILVNARYAKNVPGRKTDVSDASWLRQLRSYGLLRGSFRLDAEIATLRAYLRQRERLVEYAAAHIQHTVCTPHEEQAAWQPPVSSRVMPVIQPVCHSDFPSRRSILVTLTLPYRRRRNACGY
jgi:Transposase